MDGAQDARSAEQLVAFLKKVRQREGLARSDALSAIPEEIRAALDLDEGLTAERQVGSFVGSLARELARMKEVDPRSASYASLGLNLRGPGVYWQQRVQQRAEAYGESSRTVERRVDAAFGLLAARLLAKPAVDEPPAAEKVALVKIKKILDRLDELRVLSFDVSIRVYPDHVQVHEVIEVISRDPAAQFYVVGKTLPYATRRSGPRCSRVHACLKPSSPTHTGYLS